MFAFWWVSESDRNKHSHHAVSFAENRFQFIKQHSSMAFIIFDDDLLVVASLFLLLAFLFSVCLYAHLYVCTEPTGLKPADSMEYMYVKLISHLRYSPQSRTFLFFFQCTLRLLSYDLFIVRTYTEQLWNRMCAHGDVETTTIIIASWLEEPDLSGGLQWNSFILDSFLIRLNYADDLSKRMGYHSRCNAQSTLASFQKLIRIICQV